MNLIKLSKIGFFRPISKWMSHNCKHILKHLYYVYSLLFSPNFKK